MKKLRYPKQKDPGAAEQQLIRLRKSVKMTRFVEKIEKTTYIEKISENIGAIWNGLCIIKITCNFGNRKGERV